MIYNLYHILYITHIQLFLIMLYDFIFRVSLLNAVRPIYHEDIFEYEDLLKIIDNALEGMEPEVISAYE